MAEPTQLTVLDAAATWRDRALLSDQGVFSDDAVWTAPNLALIAAIFDAASDPRLPLESLGDQLREAGPLVVRLCAELFWVCYLPAGAGCISNPRKSEIVRTVYEWSGQTLPPSHPLLTELAQATDAGPGLFYHANRRDELRFLVAAARSVKSLPEAARREALGDPLRTGELLDAATQPVPVDDANAAAAEPSALEPVTEPDPATAADPHNPQLNHMLRYLLFPERFEPVFTRRDKRRIVESFGGLPRREVRRLSVTRLDRELASIREQLQPLYGDERLSFFHEPLVSTWRQAGSGGTLALSERRYWVKQAGLASSAAGPTPEPGRALWVSRQAAGEDAALMREIEPGDVVFHLTEGAGIGGVSVVTGEIEELPEPGNPGGASTGFRIELGEYTEVTPSLDSRALLNDPGLQGALRELARNHDSLFFTSQLTLSRGRYLSEAPETLTRIFDEAYRAQSNRHLPHLVLPNAEDLPTLADGSGDETAAQPLTQLLAGPTGTGKTYRAIARAVALCDGRAPSGHDAVMARYRELEAQDRIQLIGFHPGYGYRDFVEDVRSVTVENPDTGEQLLLHVARPGILLGMANRAASQALPEQREVDFGDSTIWGVCPPGGEDADAILADLLENGFLTTEAAGSGQATDFSSCRSRADVSARLQEASTSGRVKDETVSTIDLLVNQMETGDVVLLIDSAGACRALGRVTGGYQPRRQVANRLHTQIRPVDWLTVYREPLSWRQIARKRFLDRALYRLDASLLRVDELAATVESSAPSSDNHVLIIDEIGHGDVGAIFGELITLLDSDKRTSGSCPLTVRLAGSGTRASLPGNLYLIGTLNTNESLDPGNRELLLRRFALETLEPDASLIRGMDQLGTIRDEDGGRIDLRALMRALNDRIEALAGPEMRLGHGYFTGIESFPELVQALKTRIVPRLETSLGGDWRSIQVVLADVLEGDVPNVPQLIAHETLRATELFGSASTDTTARTRYRMTPERELTGAAFRKVYDTAARDQRAR